MKHMFVKYLTKFNVPVIVLLHNLYLISQQILNIELIFFLLNLSDIIIINNVHLNGTTAVTQQRTIRRYNIL